MINCLFSIHAMFSEEPVIEYVSDQQREIVESTARYKLINGCAGSRKTDTLVKCAARDLMLHGRPILFLTLVGSVTFEIKERLEKTLGIPIKKIGQSNHYMGMYNGIPICISNYDAWVHHMLKDHPTLDEIAECFSEKIDILLAQSTSLLCRMKRDYPVGLLILDEAQDLQSNKMQIIVNMSDKMDVYIAGDYLQTLYADEQENLDTHAMNVFKRISPEYFDLNICWRCPKAHVVFNNLLLNSVQKKYGIPTMESANENMIDKPLLFTHLKTSSNTNARINAEQITNMLRVLMEYDTTIVPDDIAVIMTKSKANDTYYQLEETLGELFLERGFKDAVMYMNTDADGRHNTLDWTRATGKAKLLSIHGDKGKGHRVVVFLGFTEGGLPRECHIYKPAEIVPESLANVALTRSTQYLLIGFCANYPSRYLAHHSTQLKTHCYIGWDNETDISDMPPIYKSMIAAQYSAQPIWDCKYRKERIIGGIKTQIKIRGDLSKDFEQTSHLVKHPWRKESKLTVFGEWQQMTMQLQEEHYLLLGCMAELLIQRLIAHDELCDMLKCPVEYSDDECFMSCMHDVSRMSSLEFEVYIYQYRTFFKQHVDLEQDIRRAFTEKRRVVHKAFLAQSFRHDLAQFTSSVSNRELSPSCIWNVALYYNQLMQKIYRPAINAFIGFFHEDITNLHSNVEAFCKMISPQVQFECPVFVGAHLTDKELKALGKDPAKDSQMMSMEGRIDLMDRGILTEIKASQLERCSQEWITQTVGYALLLGVKQIPVQKLRIVNIIAGCMWEWIPPVMDIHDAATKMAKKWNWHEVELNAFLRGCRI